MPLSGQTLEMIQRMNFDGTHKTVEDCNNTVDPVQ